MHDGVSPLPGKLEEVGEELALLDGVVQRVVRVLMLRPEPVKPGETLRVRI
jgi:hypothetical protein